MKTIHISIPRLILRATVLTLWLAVPATADSAADLLEEGIYTEETVGDLTAAIEIYTRIVEDAGANRPHVAQAQFRLAMCHLKRGNDAQAKVALEKLIQEYPEQEQVVAQAREQLAATQAALALEPAPWQDGEHLRYRISLPTGKAIGALDLLTESTVIDGIEAWRIELRKFVITATNNNGISRVLADRHTLRPISSTVRHGILGNASAVYGPDGVAVTGAKADTHVAYDENLYDSEQLMHLLRMLPLAPDYQAQFSLLPTWTAVAIDVGLEVTGTESCHGPAGELECYKVDLDIGQTLWISTEPERTLVKLEGGGVIVELVEIGHTMSGEPVHLDVADFGFASTLPTDWWFYEHREEGRTNSVRFRLLDPLGETVSSIEVDRCPNGECPSLQRMAQRELSGAEKRFEAYELRAESWTEQTIDGRGLISFVGDYQLDGNPWVQYRLYTYVDDVRLEFIFRVPADRFEALRTAFDAVVQNIETK